MSFVDAFNQIPFEDLLKHSSQAAAQDVDAVLANPSTNLESAAILLSPAASNRIEELAQIAREITWQRFGRTIQLYAPLYISNECVETCTYCGFSRENKIKRLTLKTEQVVQEAQFLHNQGFRHLLLVSGEHPRIVSVDYVKNLIASLKSFIPSISLEVAPQQGEPYKEWVQAGADGLVVYQETYDRGIYSSVHLAGKKTDFDWRLEAHDRGGKAGFRRLGIGALLGLSNWRKEILALVAHADYLLRHYWQSSITISLPRLRPAAGNFQPAYTLSNKEFVQIITALRILLPDVGLVLSTREPSALRNRLIHLGVTHMSAGSKTNPGGYSKDLEESECQFEIDDLRDANEISEMLLQNGLDPVWKDWDRELHESEK